METNPLYGVIDEFYLFERPLKQNEITLLAQTCNYERAVVYYGFDLFTGTTVYDQSGLANNGLAINGTTSSLNGTCGKAVNMTLGQIRLPGDAFREKPQKAITISVWVKLQTNRYGNIDAYSWWRYCIRFANIRPVRFQNNSLIRNNSSETAMSLSKRSGIQSTFLFVSIMILVMTSSK